MDTYFAVLSRWSDFRGRAGRSEFWTFFFVNALVAYAMRLVGHAAGIETAVVMYSLIVLVPALAVATRRLRDTGLPGWWLLAGLVPYAGPFVLVFLLARASLPDASA